MTTIEDLDSEIARPLSPEEERALATRRERSAEKARRLNVYFKQWAECRGER